MPYYNRPVHQLSDYEGIDKNADVVKPGTLLITGTPFVYALSPLVAGSRCDTCFNALDNGGKESNKEGGGLNRCGACRLVRYCGRTCQRTGWNDGHKYECGGFKKHRIIPGSFARLLLRAVVKLQNGTDYYDEITKRKIRRRFKDLVSHYPDVKNDSRRMERFRTMAEVVQSMLEFHPEVKMPNESELLGICGRIFVNTFSITDYENHTLGCGLYLGASIFDHSCEPMAVASFENTTLYIRSIREIPISLPILNVTICYRNTMRPTFIRKEELMRSYYFECQCERCNQNLYDDSMEAVICPGDGCGKEVNLDQSGNKCSKCGYHFDAAYVEKVKETEEMAKSKLDEMSDNAYLDVAEVCLRVFKTLNFSQKHWLYTEMCEVGFDGCIDLQQWQKAYDFGLTALKGYRAYLYEIHPTLGLILLKMAKLAWYLEKDEEAKAFLTEAKKILDLTHGSETPFAKQHIYPLLRQILCSKIQLSNGH